MDKNMMLEKKNSHLRDKRIQFFEDGHYYLIDGKKGYTSVTTYIHSLFPQFNADNVINKMMKSKKWPQSKYYGMTKEEIKQSWDKNRDEAAIAGTNFHRALELYYNNAPQEIPEILDTKEYNHFKEFLEVYGHKKAYRTEWSIFHEEFNLSGQIDMCYENDDGTYDIYDWKRSKEIKKYSAYESGLKEPVDQLPNTNFWHYSLQLNIYRYILEQKYGKKIKEMAIVVFHPNNDSFIRYKIPNLQDIVEELYKKRTNL